jgi:amino acid adenylation domain-containing protein
MKETALGAYAHQNLPFEKLVEELHPDRDPSRNPLFQVMFQLQTVYDTQPAARAEPRGPRLTAEKGTTQFDLAVDLWAGPGGIDGQIEYSTELFDGETIERFVRHYQKLLEGAASNVERRISELPLMSDAERSRIVVEWNRTDREYARGVSWAALFEETATRNPDGAAVICGDTVLSYAELNRRANQLAHCLRRRGVRPDTPVAISMERSTEMAVAVLGILKAGGAYVPIDPSYPGERIAFLLKDAAPELVLTQHRLAGRFPIDPRKVICLDGECSAIAAESGENPPVAATADSLAYIIYTSGSAGYPKGVLIPHRALVNHSHAIVREFELSGTDRILQFASLSFDVSAEELFPTWACGAAVVMHQGPLAFPVSEFVSLVERLGITVLNLPAPYWHEWAAELERKTLSWPRRLRLVVTGSQRLLPECVASWQRHSSVPLINAYGVTEAGITALTYRLPLGPPPAIPAEAPIGRPISNCKAYVLDQRFEPVPIGAPGELFLGGDVLMRGYLGRPDLTAEALVRDPFNDDPSARLYRTGDRVRYQPDGNIVFLGRMDQQLKLHGYRIEPAEIEAVLARHPLVREAVATLRGESAEQRLVAHIVPVRPAFEAGGNGRDGAHESDHVSQWRALYDGLYRQGTSAVDPRFNTFGWNCTATGEPIPAPEMREWLDHTVSRIQALQPERVLEIGCGLGLILFAVAPRAAAYTATDFSPIAIDYLRKELQRCPLPQVRLFECAADEFGFAGDETFDTIILNSVVQYFPSADYLSEVLRSAVKHLAPGGSIFVGDVRSLPLLEAFAGSLELQRAPARLATAQLRKRLQKRVAEEQELVLDPRFFTALTHLLPSIGQVEIFLKEGRSQNELTQFRYDVVLRQQPQPERFTEPRVWDWQELGLTLARLKRLLTEEYAGAALIRGVPNRRVAGELVLINLLAAGDQAPPTVELLRKALRTVPQEGVDPADLWELAEALSRDARISWTNGRRDGSFDVLFAPEGEDVPYVAAPTESGDIDAYANTPLLGAYTRRLIPELRSFAKRNLPDYMVPSAFVLMDSFPLLANGKLDRAALPPPDSVRTETAGLLVLPRSETEAVVARIWAGMLGLERVGVNDNFFDLGGHSLLATQVVSRLRDRFQVELPLHRLFEGPTVAHLSRAIEEAVQSEIERMSEEEATQLLSGHPERATV